MADVTAGPGQILGAIFSASPDAIIVVDGTGTMVLSSPAIEKLFGYLPEEVVGASIDTLIPTDRRERHREFVRGYLASPHARQMGVGLELAGLHRNGETFPVDVSLTPVQVRGETYVAAFVRDARERRRSVDRLSAVNEITQRFLGGSPIEEVLPLVAARARQMTAAVASWVVIPTRSGELVVGAADGADTKRLIGVEVSGETSRSAEVLRTGATQVIESFARSDNVPSLAIELGFGPGIYAPLVADGRRLGTLVVARADGAEPFNSLDTALIEVFAKATAAAIELGETRNELSRLEVVEEDERIARDLHDTVIQQLFAIGMSLQATRNTVAGVIADRIDVAVSDLDDVIREIRNTIFRLPGRTAEVRELRDELARVADKFAPDLGFTPRIGFHGSVDVVIPDVVTDELLKVYGEALSNVVRHAKATSVETVVAVEDGLLVLSVADDGVGLGEGPFAGNGLRNMEARANDLGGTFRAERREPRGTVVEWQVPL